MPPRVTEVAEQVAIDHGVKQHKVLSRCHLAKHCRARQDLFYRVRALNPRVFTYPKIGQMFGYTHANILWGVRRHAALNNLEVPNK